MSRKPKHLRPWLAGAAAAAAVGGLLPLLAPAQARADAGAPTRAGAGADAGALSARVSADCTHGRLQLVLRNASDSEQTFTVDGPDGGAAYTRTVAAGGNAELHWTRADGSPYTLRTTTASGFRRTESGTMGCGLDGGEPQMNTTTLFSTDTVFKGLVDENGDEYDGTAKSVRIPSMAVTNDGTLLAATDARVTGSGDLGAGDNNIQVALRRSTDRGAHWSEPGIVAHGATSTEGAGDSSLMVDRKTGRVYLFFNTAQKGVGYWTPEDGSGSNSADDPKSIHVQYVTSDDDGRTWSERRDLNPSVKDPSWKGLFASSGHGTQTSDGRLLQPIVYRDGDGSHAANIYSDDHGRTWHTGDVAGDGFNESKVIERGDGDVVQNMRADAGERRYYATSPDGSSSYRAPVRTSLIDPGVNADEISYLRPGAAGSAPGSGGLPRRTDVALFSNPASTTARDDLTVRLSPDDGANWPHSALIKPGAAGYSTMGVLDDGTVGDLYEVGDTGGIRFSRFSLDWLRQGS